MLAQNTINLSEVDIELFLSKCVMVQKPECQELYIGFGNNIGHGHKFHILPFYETHYEAYYPEFLIKTNLTDFKLFLNYNFEKTLDVKEEQENDSLFLKDMNSILSYLNDNEIDKLVAVTRRSYKKLNDSHPLGNLKSVQFQDASLYAYWDGPNGILGFTPEPLVQKHENQWKTRALAGTINNQMDDFKKIILNDPKELKEHEWVITDLQNKIQMIGKVDKIFDTEVVNFGKLAHLQTVLHFYKDEQISFFDMLKEFNPTAALGGYPSKTSHQYLRTLEYYKFDQDDRFFGGVIGFESDTEAYAVVCIRNIQWNETSVIVDSGCGVVADSIPEKELLEVQNKRNSILGALFE